MPLGANLFAVSNDALVPYLIPTLDFRIQLACALPFFPIAGHRLRVANTAPLRPAGTIDFGVPIPDDTGEPLETPSVFDVAEIATRFEVPFQGTDIFSSNVNDQTGVQMALAVRRLLYGYWWMFESGRSTIPRQFAGLLELTGPERTIDLAGAPLTTDDLNRAKEMVRVADGWCVVIYTTGVGKRAIYQALCRCGMSPEYDVVDVACATGGTDTQKMMTFDGARIYVCDLNTVVRWGADGHGDVITPAEATNLDGRGVATNIWFLALGWNGVFGIVPSSLGQSMFVTRSTNSPDRSSTVCHVTMPAGLAVVSPSAVSVIKNATIPFPAPAVIV